MNIYFIGIKGTGMTALAEVLLSQGHKIQGSDTNEKFYTDDILDKLNIKYFEEFDSSHISKNIDLIINSAAYNDSNPEICRGLELNIEIKNYAEALGYLSKGYFSVGVCGTHGKTTQSAMLGVILEAIGLDPLCIIGSSVPEFGNRNARIQKKKNDLFVAETCEYKRHFLNFHPSSILIPSLDFDHGDYFRDEEDYCNSFIEFIKKLPKQSKIIYCLDSASKIFLDLLDQFSDKYILESYGQSAESTYQVTNSVVKNSVQTSRINLLDIEISLSIPGEHNMMNAYGALLMSIHLFKRKRKRKEKFPMEKALKALKKFSGTKRRFEKIGEYFKALLFDDYAHHPKEIQSTLSAVKSFFPNKNIIAVFQSHTFSRTKLLEKEFAKSFDKADEIFLAPIYGSARETKDTYSSLDFANTVKKENDNVTYFDSFEKITSYLKENLTKNDLVITLGAGNVWRVIDELK